MLNSSQSYQNTLELFGFNDPHTRATFKNNVVLNTLLVASIGCIILSFVFFSTENWIDLSVTVSALVLLSAAFLFYRSGQVDVAIKVKLFGAYILMWFGIFSQGGINDAGFQILYPIFIFAVALTSRIVQRVMAVSTVILLFVLMYLENAGFFITRADPNSGVVEGLVILNVLVILYFTTQFFVSRLQESQSNLIKAKADLEQLIHEKNIFLSMLTHDMKTPLTTIGLYASLLESKPHMAQEKPRIAKSISSSQKTLLNLVNNILDVEQLQSGKAIEVQAVPVNMQQVVTDCVQSLQNIAAQKNSSLKLDLSDHELVINGDKTQLHRVVTNLVSNAIKYSPDETQVSIGLKQQENDTVLLTVEDEGYGIPEADLPHIFDFYHRVDANNDKAIGSGLGLAIVKAIVSAHDGAIDVKSKEGEGSKFSVSLPMQSNGSNDKIKTESGASPDGM